MSVNISEGAKNAPKRRSRNVNRNVNNKNNRNNNNNNNNNNAAAQPLRNQDVIGDDVPARGRKPTLGDLLEEIELDAQMASRMPTPHEGARYYRPKGGNKSELMALQPSRLRDGVQSNETQAKLDKLVRDLEKIKQQQRSIPPLAKVGTGISSGALAAIHMFCDPARAEAVPLPGRQPSSQVKCTSLADTSISLYNGEAGIIVTPMGQQQYWKTKAWNAAQAFPLVEELKPYSNPQVNSEVCGFSPAALLSYMLQGRVMNCALLKGPLFSGLTAKASVERTAPLAKPKFGHTFTASTNANNAASASAGFILTMPPQQGILHTYYDVYNVTDTANITVVSTNSVISSDSSPQSKYLICGQQVLSNLEVYSDCIPIVLTQPPAGESYKYVVHNSWRPLDTEATVRYVTHVAPVYTANTVPDRGDGINGYVAPLFVNDLTTWDGYTMPAIVNLEAGDYAKEGNFTALSGLLTNDSSSLNNGGMLMQLSTYTDAFGPYDSVKRHIASTNNRQYIGALKNGGYQIYVPTNLQLLTYNDQLMNPFVSSHTGEQYNMLYWLDYSATPLQGQQIPSVVACHFKIDGVYDTVSLSAFIQQRLIPADYSTFTALGLLRQHYAPCENPDHLDKIKEWLSKTIKGTINYGKQIITEYKPELAEVGSKAVKTLIPLAISAACAL